FAEFLRRHAGEPASGTLHEQPFFVQEPFDFDRRRAAAAKPLAVVFEQKHCAACDEMHATAFKDPATRELIGKFDIARLELFGNRSVVTPAGKRLSEEAWGRELKVAYTPTIVFFDTRGAEVFRVEAYLRPFHFTSSFDYVANGAYRTQPNFQRFLQARAEKIRAQGGKVELW
ncbi:MAG TPA: thioredoxin fold domain-containing protein, partial [Burkholderiales bacterium]|nr:thioredoxin fold domain-containing protein [Burkholderiales bacterium]